MTLDRICPVALVAAYCAGEYVFRSFRDLDKETASIKARQKDLSSKFDVMSAKMDVLLGTEPGEKH